MTYVADNPSILNLLVRLWFHFSLRRRHQFVLLLFLSLGSALAEIVSLGAILPFLGILASPEQAIKNPFVAKFASALQITETHKLILPLTIAFVIAVTISGAIRLLLHWANSRLTGASGADLGLNVYRKTLYQPYNIHLLRNSSEVISGITNKVNAVVYQVIQSVLTLISTLVFMFAILGTLLIIDPRVATIAALGFGTSYVFISQMVRRKLSVYGKKAAEEQTQVLKTLQEGLGGIRDVLLDGSQPVYCDVYARADRSLRRYWANISLIGQSPRFIMESIGMVLIAALAFRTSTIPGGIMESLPVLGALALGAQRILPALQQTYSAWVGIAGSRASLADTISLLDQPLPLGANSPLPDALPLVRAIEFKAVKFRYTADGPWILDGFNWVIHKGERIGIVGTTGSGKSTVMDLLMGLLNPTEGQILVDERVVEGGRVRAWQRSIAHVPQTIFLADATLAENIAFGVPLDLINFENVHQAASQAHIAEFIESYPEGYHTKVGERGIRLSGGQRQRVGIARALYKQATVLVFDEATSALDSVTENSVMEAIEGLDRQLTILIVAHRFSTIQRCDQIIEIENGRVVAQGTYNELIKDSPSFRRLAQLHKETS